MSLKYSDEFGLDESNTFLDFYILPYYNLTMKIKSVFFCSLLLTGSFLSAQMPGMMTMQTSVPQGTTLGANTTSGAAGIALGNRVVMRGYVDFIFNYQDIENGAQTESFTTASDIDFLFDFSPVTAEVHIAMNPSPDTGDQVTLEQAFGRYNINRDFNISFGRQLTVLGFEADEAPGLFAVTNGYWLGDRLSSHAKLGRTDPPANAPITESIHALRRNYVDGIRANFNNGRFGLSLGLHDGYWKDDDFNGHGIKTLADGSIAHYGEWKDGQPVGKSYPRDEYGWITKRGHMYPSWKKRYFRLKMGVLEYYTEESFKAECLKGSFNIAGYNIDTSTPLQIYISSSSSSSVLGGSKDMYMKFDNEGDKERWLKALQASV